MFGYPMKEDWSFFFHGVGRYVKAYRRTLETNYT
jgi:hypothetical protein